MREDMLYGAGEGQEEGEHDLEDQIDDQGEKTQVQGKTPQTAEPQGGMAGGASMPAPKARQH